MGQTASFPHQPAHPGVSEQAASPSLERHPENPKPVHMLWTACTQGPAVFPAFPPGDTNGARCHHGAQQGYPVLVGHKGSLPVPRVSCAHADRDMFPHLTLCPVPQAGGDTGSPASWFPCGGRGGRRHTASSHPVHHKEMCDPTPSIPPKRGPIPPCPPSRRRRE